jgi:hypothetical protein
MAKQKKVTKGLSKKQAIESIKKELKLLLNSEKILKEVSKDDPEGLQQLIASVQKDIGPETAAAAILAKIVNKRLVFGWIKV